MQIKNEKLHIIQQGFPEIELDVQKIKLARRLCCYSMDELCKRMGKAAVSKMAISKIERGIFKPSLETLKAIAKACNVPLEYFYQQDIRISQVNFRFTEDISERKAEEIRAQVISAIIDYATTNSCVPIPQEDSFSKVRTTLRSFADAEEAASRLRKKWNIGLQPIFSVYELLQNHGVHIIELEIDNQCIDGVSTYVNGKIPIIVINTLKHKTTERKRFTALHELAHLLFRMRPLSVAEHEEYISALPSLPYEVTMKHADTECLCNLFASAMLLPSQVVIRRIGNTRSNIDIKELISIREMYGISIAATVHRLHDLRIIPDTLYNYYYDSIIKPNIMETGWGVFPIMEKAEMKDLLRMRLENEMTITNNNKK